MKILTLFGEEEVIDPEVQEETGKPFQEETLETLFQEEANVTVATSLDMPATTLLNTLEVYEGPKQYYSIGEVAALFKANVSQIRFWTKEFRLKVRTTRRGERLYTNEEIRELATIHRLVKEKKYTLRGAKKKIQTEGKAINDKENLKQTLITLKNRLLEIRNLLTA